MSSNLFSKVFRWMSIGLLITFATGYIISNNGQLAYLVFNNGLYIPAVIIEFILVIFLSSRVQKMTPFGAKLMFCLYSFVSGITFSSIFITYELTSIMNIFLVTAIVFGLFSFIGFTTKKDLSNYGMIFFMGIIGILIVSIFNMFLHNSMIYYIISWVSIILFVGITAYDVQKIKRMSSIIKNEDTLAIMGALELYLDFINIFIDLLRIFGKSKD